LISDLSSRLGDSTATGSMRWPNSSSNRSRCARRPHVEIGRVTGAELESDVVAPIDHGDFRDDLEVVGVRAVGRPQQGGQA
jgi:hypothetical protein